MVVEHGTVIEVGYGTAKVRTCPPSACIDCAHAETGCAFGAGSRTIEVADPLGVRPGQIVRLSVPRSAAAAAVLILYGLPVAGLVLGAVFGSVVAEVLGAGVSNNVAAAGGAFALLCVAVVVARVADRKLLSDPGFIPRIAAVVDEEKTEIGEAYDV